MQKKQSIEQMFCNKLLELMEKKPISQIRTTDLVKFTGTCRSTFYNYFDSIYSVLQMIEDNFFHELEQTSSAHLLRLSYETPTQVISSMHIASMQIIRDHEHVLRVLLGPNGSPSFSAKLKKCVRHIYQSFWTSTGINLTDTQTRFLLEFSTGASFAVVKWYAQYAESLNEKESAEVLGLITKLNYRSAV